MSIDKDFKVKYMAALTSEAEKAGDSAENAEKKVSGLTKSFDFLAVRMNEVSDGAKAVGKFYKNAQDLDISISDTTDTFVKEMNAVSKRLDAIKKGTDGKDKKEATATKAAALAKEGAGGTDIAALADATTEGEKEYAGQADKQLDVQNNKNEKNNEQQVIDEKKMWADRVSAAGRGAGMMSNIMQNLYQATGQKSKAMFTAMKAFAIAETIIQTYRAAQGAYAAMAKIHPALGVAAAAVAISAGMARVKAIASTKPKGATGTISAGGKANPSYYGGSTTAYPVPLRNEEEPKPTQQITMNIYNPLSEQNWAEIAENNIGPALSELAGRNVVVDIHTIA